MKSASCLASLSLLWTSASSAVFHRVSVLLVCCAEQGMGEYMEAHDRLGTGLTSWCLCIGRPHVLLPCVGLGSFACPVVMYSCAMVGPLRCCVCMSVSAPSTRVGLQWIRVYVYCAHQRVCVSLLCIAASLVHVLMAGSCLLLKSASRSCCIMLPPRFLIGGAVLQARPRCTRVHRIYSGQ